MDYSIAWARNLPPDDFPDYDLPPDRRRPSTPSFSNHNNNNINNNNNNHHHSKKSTTNLPLNSSHQGSYSPSSSSTHHPLTPTSLTQPLPTYIPQSGSAGVDKWWTFNIPSKYGERVRDYVHSGAGLLSTDGGEKGKSKSLKEGENEEEEGEGEKRFSKEINGGKDLEKGGNGEGMQEESNYLSLGARLAPGVFSANQTLVRFPIFPLTYNFVTYPPSLLDTRLVSTLGSLPKRNFSRFTRFYSLPIQ